MILFLSLSLSLSRRNDLNTWLSASSRSTQLIDNISFSTVNHPFVTFRFFVRLSSLSKSLAGTHRFTRPPFPFLSLSTWINRGSTPPRCTPLYRENVSSTTSFQQFQSRSTVTAFLISPPGRFYATPSPLSFL